MAMNFYRHLSAKSIQCTLSNDFWFVMSVKQRIHQNFYTMGSLIATRPKSFLVFALIIATLFCLSLPSLRIDTSNESNLDKSHPEVQAYSAFHELYGYEESVVLMVKTEQLFDKAFLEKLRQFHFQLETEVVHLDSLKSIISTSLIFAEDDELLVEDLISSFPEDEKSIALFKQRALDNPTFRDLFFSRNLTHTAIYLHQQVHSPTLLNGQRQPFTSMDQHKYVESIRAVVAQNQADDFDITISGGPIIGDTLLSRIAFETPLFSGLANLVIIILLYALFRRVSAVLLPLLVINISLASLFGLMAFFDVALSSFSQILPSFILTVGVCDSVHFLSHFYMRYEQHGDKKLAIEQALSHTGMPMMLTSLTTAVGMLSFAITEIIPIRSLGVFAAAGVLIVWFYTIVLLPALLSLIPVTSKAKGVSVLDSSQSVLLKLGQMGWQHPFKVIGFFASLLIVAVIAVSQLTFEHDPVKWLPDDSELPTSIKLMNEEFYGAIAVEMLVDTGAENGVKTTEFMQMLDDLNQHNLAFASHGVQLESSRSIVDTLKQVHLALNNNVVSDTPIADSDDLVAQELLLFEMSGGSDLHTQVNSDFSTARVTALGQWRDLIAYSKFLDEFEVSVKDLVADAGEVTFTGVVYLLSPIQRLAIHTMANSYVSATIIITFMMILMIGSLRLGLLSMIPNLLPIILGMGFMAISGMSLDLYSILIGSIAIGLVVDDTVHFIHGFQYNYEKLGNAQEAVEETLKNTGNALLFTTILLFGGFMTYSFSELVNMSDFGMITGAIVVLALVSDIILLPALLALMYGRKDKA